MMTSQRSKECQQISALGRRHGDDTVARRLRFAAVPQDGLHQTPRPPVMEKERGAADGLGQADAPQGRGAPVLARRSPLGPVVSQARPHVVEQEIGIGPDGLVGLLGVRVDPGVKHGLVARRATRVVEKLLALQNTRIARLTARRHTEILE